MGLRAVFVGVVLVLVAFGTGVESGRIWSSLRQDQQQRVRDIVDSMTLDEKIGQMTQGERLSLTTADVTNLFIGSVLSGGGSVPGDNTLEDWQDMYDEYQKAALDTRLAIPIIYGQDAVHGVNNVYGATIFPHNVGLGAANDPDLVARIGQVVAEELCSCGSTWTFAPCIAVPQDDRWGRTYEGFGELPELQSLGTAYVNGLQGAPYGAIGCSKHYLGDGGTKWGTGYIEAVEAGVGTVMVSYSSWNGDKMSGHTYLITDVLKNELGFDGFVVSDWDAILELPGSFYDQVVASVNAGMDMFMMPYDWQDFIDNLKKAVNKGDVLVSRIDDAVTRILAVKTAFGLFDHPFANRSIGGTFGNSEHRNIAREAVQKSMVLLQNRNSLLPLTKNNITLFVAGVHADDIGLQCGGWTISWQGSAGPITTGTTILDGIRESVSGYGTVDYDANGNNAANHDVAIVVVGEYPYAEGVGDASSLDLASDQQALINEVSSAVGADNTVVVIVSGRPLVLPSDTMPQWGALVAAFLPGTEAGGLADVLFGDAPFSGRLPLSWPRSTSQEPINFGDSTYDPLFPYGFGL
ncbi:carbohydrate-binding protein [Pelomyxa schiedti]|nr:carbohydrate-binding protein [Pelomyxa schiedti]